MTLSCTPNKIFLDEGVDQLEAESYFEKLSKTEHSYIMDIRTPLEYNKGHIEGAINISYIGFSFSNRVRELDKNKTIFIYCQTAHRSPFAAKKLKSLGFTKIIDLKGGYKTLK